MRAEKINLSLRRVVAIVFMIGLLSSCATSSYKLPLTYSEKIQTFEAGGGRFWPSEDLRSAFTDYWTMRYSGNFKGAYAKEVPYFRELVGYPKYESIVKNYLRAQLLGMEIVNVEKVRDCFYQIGVTFNVQSVSGEKNRVSMIDEWVNERGVWRHVIRDGILFPEAS